MIAFASLAMGLAGILIAVLVPFCLHGLGFSSRQPVETAPALLERCGGHHAHNLYHLSDFTGNALHVRRV